MKRSLFMLGVAVAALSSCSQSEILEVAEGRAIGFSSFVNNNTRAAITEIAGTDDLTEYYVYGYHTDNIPVFENVKVNTNGTNIRHIGSKERPIILLHILMVIVKSILIFHSLQQKIN